MVLPDCGHAPDCSVYPAAAQIDAALGSKPCDNYGHQLVRMSRAERGEE